MDKKEDKKEEKKEVKKDEKKEMKEEMKKAKEPTKDFKAHVEKTFKFYEDEEGKMKAHAGILE